MKPSRYVGSHVDPRCSSMVQTRPHNQHNDNHTDAMPVPMLHRPGLAFLSEKVGFLIGRATLHRAEGRLGRDLPPTTAFNFLQPI